MALVSVGAEVGTGVGAEVGTGVGAKVGTGVGAEVGTGVGVEVGTSVGIEVGTDIGAEVGTGALVVSLVGAAVVADTVLLVASELFTAGVDEFGHSGNRVIHCWHSVSFFAHRARQQYKLHGFSSSAIHASPSLAQSLG